MTTSQIKIIAYLKPHCGWSRGVRAVLDKYHLSYEDRDIIGDPAQREEMVQKSKQSLSPCVEVNGVMLPDISGEELEQHLLTESLVQPSSVNTDVPLAQGCPGHGVAAAEVGQIASPATARKSGSASD